MMRQGLIPCITQDGATGEVLMFAWMNAEAVARTLATKQVTYWSRSRAAFWIKGETSGHTQSLIDLRIDCDRDCLLAVVSQTGPACHTNRRSCFLHRRPRRRRNRTHAADGLTHANP